MLETHDILKLNVLIATSKAIRIDFYKLEIVGLNDKFEEKIIKLESSDNSTLYIKKIQQLLVEKILGTIGSYPAYLKNWARMGQVDSNNLANLLKIGDINAVIAVVNSKNFDKSLLDLAWWCATNTDEQNEIARFLLSKKELLSHPTCKKIANYLLEFIPFIENTLTLINIVNLILQNNLISDKQKTKLWQMGQRKTAFLIGFLERQKGKLPINNVKNINYSHKELQVINGIQNQAFLKTCKHILKKINQEYVLYRTLEAIKKHFKHPDINSKNTIEELQQQAKEIATKLNAHNNDKVIARLFLAGVSEKLVITEISAHALNGSTIRKKLSYIIEPINYNLFIISK